MMMMIIAIAFAATSCGYPVSTETRQSLYAAAMAAVAFDAFSVSDSNLISIAVGNRGLPSTLKLDKTREEVAAD
jgi:hypothetical protein